MKSVWSELRSCPVDSTDHKLCTYFGYEEPYCYQIMATLGMFTMNEIINTFTTELRKTFSGLQTFMIDDYIVKPGKINVNSSIMSNV